MLLLVVVVLPVVKVFCQLEVVLWLQLAFSLMLLLTVWATLWARLSLTPWLKLWLCEVLSDVECCVPSLYCSP
ncbi:MAG: hypothetical protein QW689_05560 [Nitrososphaerota archaeon]